MVTRERSMIESLQKRPQMYVFEGSYKVLSSFIAGYNAGLDGRLLEGFSSWLSVKLGEENSLSWESLILELAFPQSPNPQEELKAESKEKLAVKMLFDNVLEYLTYTGR